MAMPLISSGRDVKAESAPNGLNGSESKILADFYLCAQVPNEGDSMS
jgi:hypothetical protein